MLHVVGMTLGEKTHFQLCRAQYHTAWQHYAACRYQAATANCDYDQEYCFSPQSSWSHSEKCPADCTEADWLSQAKHGKETWNLQKRLREDPESLWALKAAEALIGILGKLLCHQNSLFVVRALLLRSIEHTLELEVQKLEAVLQDVIGDKDLMGDFALGSMCTGSHKNLMWFMEFFLHHHLFNSLRVMCEFALDSPFTDVLLRSKVGNLVCQRALLCANFVADQRVFGALLHKAMSLAERWMLAERTPWMAAGDSHYASHFIIECVRITALKPTRWADFLDRCNAADPKQLGYVCEHKTGKHLMAHLASLANKENGNRELADKIFGMLGGAVNVAVLARPLTPFQHSILPGKLELRRQK